VICWSQDDSDVLFTFALLVLPVTRIHLGLGGRFDDSYDNTTDTMVTIVARPLLAYSLHGKKQIVYESDREEPECKDLYHPWRPSQRLIQS
jgi:hypothetical protein